ncbi:MAG: AraC family transcriptional regulator [Lachnospiraceae bacterium]|nr:AraC family transcriptional regulator [Lachnospiraceae bacterium]
MEKEYLRIVSEFTETESFYKRLYQKKCEGEQQYRDFIHSLNREKVLKHHVYVPGLVEPEECFGEEFPIFYEVSDIAVWKHSRYTPGFLHSHNYFEIACVMSGEASHYIEGTGYFNAKPGDIFILPTGTRHMVETFDDDTFIINIMIRKTTFQYTFFETLAGNDILSDFFEEEILGTSHKSFLYFETGEDEAVRNCIQHLFIESVRRRKYHDRIEKGFLQILFAYILRKYEDYYVTSPTDDKIKLFKYFKENIHNATLSSAAEFFNYNPAYLSRLVRQSTGKTFSELKTQYRMDMAIRLLNDSALKIHEIAKVIGYENVEQFNRQFKKMLNVSPSQFRRRGREEEE